MNIEQIKEVISNYEKLYDLATQKIEVISKLDPEYDTRRRIENISFYDDSVSVCCDDTFRGCTDTHSFSFPTIWLSKTDLELQELVVNERKLREEKSRKLKEQLELEKKTRKLEQELKEYNRLKSKFEV